MLDDTLKKEFSERQLHSDIFTVCTNKDSVAFSCIFIFYVAQASVLNRKN